MLALCLTALLPAPALAAGTAFSDVAKDAWYAGYVADLVSAGAVDGYPDGTFRPAGSVTVGEAVKLIVLAAGYSEQTPTGSHWASGYLDFASAKGFTDAGQTDAPDAPADRLFVARTAARAAGLLQARHMDSPFADTSDGYVLELYKVGVVDGSYGADGALVYKPGDTITRAEMSALVWRMRSGDIHRNQIRVDWYWADVLPGVPENDLDAACFSAASNGRAVYTAAGARTRTGVDVSRFQGDVDWPAVAADGVDFVMLRLGYRGYGSAGSLNLDEKFLVNARAAAAAGLKVGVYFFSQAVSTAEAQEEADFVLSYLKGLDITFPVAFDWELPGSYARTANVDVDTLTACANVFCGAVKAAGYTPLIYCRDYEAYVRYDLSLLTAWDIWYAQYAPAPSFRYRMTMWQYSDQGSVKGIDGRVDMDLCFADYN